MLAVIPTRSSCRRWSACWSARRKPSSGTGCASRWPCVGALGADAWLAERRQRWIIGTPDQAHAQIEAFAAAGVQRIMLQDFLPRDLEMVALLGRIAAG